jgi:hypothetical protein
MTRSAHENTWQLAGELLDVAKADTAFADLYTRLGAKLGWAKRQIWTLFDAYVASPERKLLPLVGDVRFGGLHDLVTVGGDYDSVRLFARFAIVQRRGSTPW